MPYIGHGGAALFALGIFEAGLVAAVTISTSSAYAFGEVMQRVHSLNAPVREAWPFYAVLLGSAGLAGGVVLIPGAPLESIVILVNVVATLAMPPALVFLLLLANDPAVMGRSSQRLGAQSRRLHGHGADGRERPRLWRERAVSHACSPAEPRLRARLRARPAPC